MKRIHCDLRIFVIGQIDFVCDYKSECGLVLLVIDRSILRHLKLPGLHILDCSRSQHRMSRKYVYRDDVPEMVHEKLQLNLALNACQARQRRVLGRVVRFQDWVSLLTED